MRAKRATASAARVEGKHELHGRTRSHTPLVLLVEFKYICSNLGAVRSGEAGEIFMSHVTKKTAYSVRNPKTLPFCEIIPRYLKRIQKILVRSRGGNTVTYVLSATTLTIKYLIRGPQRI